ncbi:alanine racemase [Thermus scotoductus]|uniref:Alanine racemase n=7 Tax=Thermus scotoductus TaxID=37636 RepID=A0A430VKU3_THESC|nr:alanine racemase [Thermus scotoductus]RTG94401.1 alanine racemase [Thermus scotoductus]RTH08623.1 alanine racemase [Thermus scotoductus]RTH14316.1 alanine racemase [Thermus scotoductus]RTH24607.1 alanine racemase [Thermus scotoductus]RTH29989.1 alanine racemase [Thermus scotoductus]
MGHATAYLKTRAWIEVDLKALEANWLLLKAKARGEVIPVLKAEAYGHGALPLARFLFQKGARWVAVATVSEGRTLREGGVEGEILLLGSLHPLEAEEVLRLNLLPTLSTLEAAQALAGRARALGLTPRAHLKVDTGMNRVGFPWEEAKDALLAVEALGIRVEGVYTHLATAGEDEAFVEVQRSRFQRVREALGEGYFYHLENSHGLLLHGGENVRVGLALYGLIPGFSLKPILRLLARPTLVKQLGPGDRVGYGGEYVARGGEWLLTLPVGYADGLPRGAVRFVKGPEGGLYPVAGRISMDQTTVLSPGPLPLEAVLEVLSPDFGPTGLCAWAEARGTIPYEVAVHLSRRFPRVYRYGEEVWEVLN